MHTLASVVDILHFGMVLCLSSVCIVIIELNIWQMGEGEKLSAKEVITT